LDGFGVPAFSGQVVAFSAKRGTVRGIYADFFDGYPEVHKLVEVNDPTPEGDTYFQLWDPAAEPSSGQVVAFPSRTFSAINGYGYGLYRSLGSSAGASTVALDRIHYYALAADGIAVDSGTVLYVGDGTQGILSSSSESRVRVSVENAVGASGRI